MVSNQTGVEVGYLAAEYPERLGHLYSPGGERGPWAFLPYALDNGAWPAFKNAQPWLECEWKRLLRWAALTGQRPLWAIVPDVVGDRLATLERWGEYVGEVTRYGFRPAFAIQDGMTFDDVPAAAEVLFLGGSDEWKDSAIEPWCRRFPGRVHVGRVNSHDRLMRCYRAGAVSVDGTSWFRHGRRNVSQKTVLTRFLEHSTRELAERSVA